MLTLEKVKSQAAVHQRTIIRPRVDVHAKTAEQKQRAVQVARSVIREHYDVLVALKDR